MSLVRFSEKKKAFSKIILTSYTPHMPDTALDQIKFPVVVTVNNVRVEVVLLLKPGTTVTQERPASATPIPPKSP
jgi:hypothetical protein